MQLELPDDLQTEVTAMAAASGWASVDESVADLLRADTSDHDEPSVERLLLQRNSAPVAGEMIDADFGHPSAGSADRGNDSGMIVSGRIHRKSGVDDDIAELAEYMLGRRA